MLRPSPRAPPARQEGPCGLLPEGSAAGAGLSLQDQEAGRSALVSLPQPVPQAESLRCPLPRTGPVVGTTATTPSGDPGTQARRELRPRRLNMPLGPM